jgi:hypothetical protein
VREGVRERTGAGRKGKGRKKEKKVKELKYVSDQMR